MLSFHPHPRRVSTPTSTSQPRELSTPHPIPSRHPSHILVTTHDITPNIPQGWIRRMHHRHHLLSIMGHTRYGWYISLISFAVYIIPLIVSAVMIAWTWNDTCDQPLIRYLMGVAIHTCLALSCFIVYIRISQSSLLLSSHAHRLYIIRWMITLLSCAWLGMGSYWTFQSTHCSSLLLRTSQSMLLFFYISHTITICITLSIICGLSTCMGMLSEHTHMEGVLRAVPVKTYEPDELSLSSSHCHLCLSRYHPAQQLRQFHCTHHYHRICAEQWLSLLSTCPICRIHAITMKKPDASIATITSRPTHDDEKPIVARLFARSDASSHPASETSRGRATTQMLSITTETPTRTIPVPPSASTSSALAAHDDIELFVNPVMSALQAKQEALQSRQEHHHAKTMSSSLVVPQPQPKTASAHLPHLRPPAQRGSQTHRPSLIRTVNPTQWETVHTVLRAMSDPGHTIDIEEEMPPYEPDSDEEMRDEIRLRRVRAFTRNRPAFLRPLPHPRSYTVPSTPKHDHPFVLPSVPVSREDSQVEAEEMISDVIPGHAPGEMVMTRRAMVSFAPEVDRQPSTSTRRLLTVNVSSSQPTSPHLRIDIDEESDDSWVETPDPVLHITPINTLMQQLELHRVRRTQSQEGLAEAHASEERTRLAKQQRQRQEEMAQLRQFATTLKTLGVPKTKPMDPRMTHPVTSQPQRPQPPPPTADPPVHLQTQHLQHHPQHQPRAHAQSVAPFQPRGPVPSFDPRVPTRHHAQTVTQKIPNMQRQPSQRGPVHPQPPRIQPQLPMQPLPQPHPHPHSAR